MINVVILEGTTPPQGYRSTSQEVTLMSQQPDSQSERECIISSAHKDLPREEMMAEGTCSIIRP